MRVTFNIFNPQQGEQDSLVTLDVFPETTLETVREFIQAESGVSPLAQHIYHNGRLISDETKTLDQIGIADGEMLAVHVREARTSTSTQAQPQAQPQAAPPPRQQQQQQRRPQQGGRMQDPEMIRLQILGTPAMRQQLQNQNPTLAAAVDDSARFAQLLNESHDREQRERMDRQREVERLNENPFDVENQRKIEEMIRQERVMENLQNAMEHNPEVFGRVHMLYLDVEVNGHKVKAMVDSGAQATIMSPSCAEACGISRLIDTRFAGIARGVGTARIIGRVHTAQIKMGSLYLPCSFTVMEGKSVDMLLGLDMLKRFQACLDLSKDALIIHGEAIPFLGEAELPKEEEQVLEEPTVPGPAGTQIGQRSGAVVQAESQQQPQQPATPQQSSAPATATSQTRGTNASVSEQKIETLISMGADRARAIQALQAAGDDVDMAAGILFFS